jgi:hypothetical protein
MTKTTVQLIHENTGRPVLVGDRVITFRGQECTLQSIHAPRHAASAGEVTVSFAHGRTVRRYYPGVIGCRIVVTPAAGRHACAYCGDAPCSSPEACKSDARAEIAE